MAVAIRLSFDDIGIGQRLTDAGRALGDLTPLMQRIAAAVELSVRDRFAEGHGPGGVPWTKSRRAVEQGGQTLIDSTRLLDSIVGQSDARSAEVGTNVIYAAIHQFGGTIVPKDAGALHFRLPNGSFVTVSKVTIPARPFLGIDQADEVEIGKQVDDWLTGLLS